jgi:hypothetical protein
MEPIFNLMWHDQLITTGTIERCEVRLMGMTGDYTARKTTRDLGWRFEPIPERRKMN